eukprot:gene6049-biopygen415
MIVAPKQWKQFQSHSDQVARRGRDGAEVFHSDQVARSMSHPQLMFKTRDGRLIDDYRQSYLWVKDNTPPDSRIMAWWDYGYQIAGIANRTSIADGNTSGAPQHPSPKASQ